MAVRRAGQGTARAAVPRGVRRRRRAELAVAVGRDAERGGAGAGAAFGGLHRERRAGKAAK